MSANPKKHKYVYAGYGKVTFDDLILQLDGSGVYGLNVKTLVINDTTIKMNASTEPEHKNICLYGMYSYDLTLNDSYVDIDGFCEGIHSTLTRIYNSRVEVIASKIGIDVDWLTGIGTKLSDDTYTTEINVIAQEGGVSSYDSQEWIGCKVVADTVAGHGIYTVDTTIRAYDSYLSGTTGRNGDGIHAYRIYANNSIVIGKSGGLYNAGIRCSINSAQSSDEEDLPFIMIENSLLVGEGNYAALYGVGHFYVNGEEAYEDEEVHFLNVDYNRRIKMFGLFPLSVTECVLDRVEAGTTMVTVPLNCAKSVRIDARL